MDLYIDPTTMDLVFAETHIKRVSGLDEVAQRILITCKMHEGEWAYDLEAGMPWRGEILRRGATDEQITARMTAKIAAVEGVKSVRSLRIVRVPATRQATIYIEAMSLYGAVTVSMSAPAA
jgi:hypothetical protein